jgi:malonyl-CoA O-methyltransferase
VSDDHWIFLHGWGSDSTLWLSLCEHLPGTHHFIDLPGFGAALETKPDLETFLAQTADRLPDNSLLVGWSLGGMLAAQLAWRYPQKVRALITLAANAVFSAREDWPQAMDQSTFARFMADFEAAPIDTWNRFCALQSMGDGNRKHILKTLKEQSPPAPHIQQPWQQGLIWLAQLDNRAPLAQLRIPQLHLLGAGDSLVPAACAEHLAELLPADGRVELLTDLGHALHVSDPQRVAGLILDWPGARKNPEVMGPAIAKSKIARSFGDAAAIYDQYAHVQRRLAEDLVNLCPLFNAGAKVLDLGCGTGFVAELLNRKNAELDLYLADLALPMVRQARLKLSFPALAADAEFLPFADNSFNGIVSSLTLQWCRDLTPVARGARRILQPGGRLIFSTLGPGTLAELKNAWRQVDTYTHVNHFQTPEQIKRELEAAGLNLISVAQYSVVAEYAELMSLLKELKAIGAHNMNSTQKPGLTGLHQLRKLERAYQSFRNAHGQLPATYDVLLVHAQK